jgi:ADP-L-glycero-D-manno-heptose 6-epimerase
MREGRGRLQPCARPAYKRAMIVVTGGAGFIGSNLLAGLEAHGARDLVCVDWFGGGDKWKNVAKRALADVLPPEDLPAFLAARKGRVETVFHMGANSATTETDVDSIVKTNIRATLDLWDWCAANGAAFVYASSAATYGDGTLGFDDDPSPQALARLRPLNPYGWSKHMVDRRIAELLRDPKAARPRQHVGLKFFNVYGPNEAHKGPMRSVVHQVHPVAARGEAFPLFRSHRPDVPDGGQTRDFVWVGDVVDVMLWLRDHPKVSGLFNLGSGKGRSFLDLATAVYSALGKNAAIAWRDTPEAIRDKYQYFTEAKMDRLRAAGYSRPFTSIEEGVRKYVLDHLVKEDPFV